VALVAHCRKDGETEHCAKCNDYVRDNSDSEGGIQDTHSAKHNFFLIGKTNNLDGYRQTSSSPSSLGK
jgi:hypothetical protein